MVSIRAQSVTTTARGSVASTVVTYSHVASHSSPAVVQLVDTVTPSHSSVPVSEHLTRPTVLYQTSPSQSLPRTSKYSDQQFTTGQFSSHQQGQNPIPQQIVFPRLSVQDPSRLSSIQTVPQATQNKQPPPYYVLQSLLVNVDDEHQPSQQPQRSPLKQAQLSPVSTPVNASGQRPYSPQTSSVINKQSDLLKQLLVQNLLQQQQKQLQAEQQKQEPSQHHNLTVQQLLQQRAAQQKKEQLQQRCLTLQQLLQPQNKPVPTHTVQYRPHYTERSDLVEVSVPSKSPPPYHSIQRVPEVSGLSSDQASDSGGLSPMTLGTAEPSIPSEKMESRLGGFDTFINTCGDMPFSTEFIDASIYASSPNSLFMYDQEKIDMQSTLASCVTCSNVDKMVVSDDFELKTQYEISQDLRPISVTSASDRSGTFSSSYDGGGGQMWGDGALKSIKEDVMIKSESRSNTSAPTLAELNFNLDLLEDIETVISVDMNSCQVSAPRDSQPVIKQEPECTFNREQGSSLAGQTQTQRTPELVYTKLVNAQPVPDTKVVVKTEPEEKDMKPSENGQFAPQVQTLTTSWFKNRSQSSNSQLTTVKQLDLSDARTLRHLLINERTASPVKIPRKRTVSESATLNSASRKRAYPTGESMDKKWEEIKQFIHMETSSEEVEPPTPSRQSPIKRERRRNFSECSAVTMTSNEDDESDSDRDIDDDSDSDLEDGHDLGSLNPEESLIGEKDKQYFWQYNVQSKGPKGTRAHFEMEEDPHFLNDFEDPVFDPTNNNMAGVGISIKHGGKARKGDGNDIVPSPKKLCQIGLQLRKINRQINDFLPVSELPSAARNKSRKEKNKLASRACRLKKKAQHEANKVKLHGLEMEHRQLLTVIRLMRRKLTERITSTVKQEGQLSMTETLEQQIAQNLTTMIGGNTTDYVNKIVHQVEAGDVTGGIHIKATRSYPKELHN